MKSRSIVIGLALAVLISVTGCIPAKSGARCRSTDWGDGGSHVLRCVNGRWRPVMTRQQAIDAVIAIANASKKPAPGQVVVPQSLGAANLPNTADPSVFVEGGLTYVYATSTFRAVPVVVLDDVNATLSSSQMFNRAVDAMPTKPAWASTTEIWAPTVNKVGGRYVMFFAAHRSGAPDPNSDQCVGRAIASSPRGPFEPDPAPMNCGNNGVSGALDPSLYVDPSGNPSLLVAMGGSATNIWSIPLNANADATGPAVALLTRSQPWQDWFLENPAMIYDGSVYLLAYSAGRWDSGSYMTGIARCSSPAGPCTDRAEGPWLASIADRAGPGGLEFFVGPDGAARVAFHTYPANDIAPIGKRATHIQRFFTDPWPRLG